MLHSHLAPRSHMFIDAKEEADYSRRAGRSRNSMRYADRVQKNTCPGSCDARNSCLCGVLLAPPCSVLRVGDIARWAPGHQNPAKPSHRT
ncbi:hypothetical protein PsYK624_156620 [Phanerochaete sordida]|uniref:Uncharacterized protein n=1 Tax=Phanerochaete sordida TaxID=48140 RepID=A0A9P3GRA8_9APHY|nr:hypothetical protein PsYK624_156620 [Phanerochaete sordida]